MAARVEQFRIRQRIPPRSSEVGINEGKKVIRVDTQRFYDCTWPEIRLFVARGDEKCIRRKLRVFKSHHVWLGWRGWHFGKAIENDKYPAVR